MKRSSRRRSEAFVVLYSTVHCKGFSYSSTGFPQGCRVVYPLVTEALQHRPVTFYVYGPRGNPRDTTSTCIFRLAAVRVFSHEPRQPIRGSDSLPATILAQPEPLRTALPLRNRNFTISTSAPCSKAGPSSMAAAVCTRRTKPLYTRGITLAHISQSWRWEQ